VIDLIQPGTVRDKIKIYSVKYFYILSTFCSNEEKRIVVAVRLLLFETSPVPLSYGFTLQARTTDILTATFQLNKVRQCPKKHGNRKISRARCSC